MQCLTKTECDMRVLIYFLLLICCFAVGCATTPTDVSSEHETPVNIDISRIDFSHPKQAVPVYVSVINPGYVYQLPWGNIGSSYVSGTHVHNLRIGAGMASVSPLIWSRYFAIAHQKRDGSGLSIEMDVMDVKGNGVTDLSGISLSGAEGVVYSGRLELTLVCRMLSNTGGMIAEYVSPQRIIIEKSNDRDTMHTIVDPATLIIKGFNDILPKFFNDRRVMAAISNISQAEQTVDTGLLNPVQPNREAIQGKSRTRAWAVVIGISTYKYAGKSGLTDLIFADDDALAFSKSLERLGWCSSHIKLLLNEAATERNIKIAMESWLTKSGPEDQIVLFWAGHGYSDPEELEKVYFACYDTDMAIPATGYRMDRVRRALEEIRAKNVIILADTCHAGKIITRGERGLSIVPNIEKIRREERIPKGWIYMVGADTDRQAIEHSSWSNGAFTHALLKGLAGQADGFQSAGRQDGIITMGELKEFMMTFMPDETLKILGVAKRPVIITSSGDPDIWNITIQRKD